MPETANDDDVEESDSDDNDGDDNDEDKQDSDVVSSVIQEVCSEEPVHITRSLVILNKFQQKG